MRLRVRVKPRSSRPGIEGFSEGVLKIKVSSPPVEGKANEECQKLLADWLGVARSDVILARGARSRDKAFDLSERAAEALETRKNE